LLQLLRFLLRLVGENPAFPVNYEHPAARLGNEKSQETRGKTDQSGSAVSVAVSSVHGDDLQLTELVEIWQHLDDETRSDMLSLARELVGQNANE
jgi:hypothetical protein